MFLELIDVIKLYKPENESLQVPALRGVDLEIEEGELTAIIGPSGSGKSTLIKMIGAIEPPSSGTVEMEGIGLINDLKGQELNKYHKETLGFIYQFPEQNLVPSMSVIDNITLPMRMLGKLSREAINKRAIELLNAIDLYSHRKHKATQLSGGEAQRISIAVALANNPRLIIADEPTGELDSDNTFRIINYFKDLNEQYGTSIIVVTHDERFAFLTNKTYKLLDGRIYGLHRQLKDNMHTKETLLYVDRQGNIRIPEDLKEKARIKKHVIMRYEPSKQILEIIPVNRT